VRRLLAVLLLLCARPALGGSALVVHQTGAGSGEVESDHYWLAVMSTLGIDYRLVPHIRLQSYELRNAVYDDFANGTSASAVQYDCVIVLGYRAGSNLAGAANMDSLLTGAGWSNQPVLLISPSVRNSTTIWSGGAFDSTGFGATNSTGVSTFEETSEYYGPDPQYSWHQGQGYAGFPAGDIPPGQFTALLKQNANPWYDYRKIDLSVPAWDSLRTGTDTLTLVRRYRVDASGNPTGAPLILCGTGYQIGAPEGSLRRVVCALAALDSACGGDLLYQTRPGPVTLAAQIQVIGGSGRYTASSADGLDGHAGIFMPAGVDSGNLTRLQAVFDSLQAHGVKASVGVQMNYDSTGTSSKPYYAQLVALRDRWPLAKVFPFELGGLGVLGSATYAGANNDTTRNYDGFGAARVRSLLPAGYTGLIDTCHCGVDRFTAAADTGSVYCNLKRQRLNAAAFFGQSRVDRVWGAPFEDWSPLSFGNSTAGFDSLKWVLHKVGIVGLRVGVMARANDTGGGLTGAPRGLFRSQSIEPVYDVSRWGTGGTGPSTAGGATTQKRAIGTMVFLPSRDPEAATNSIYQSRQGHDNPTEYLNGVFTGRWYNSTPSPAYPGSGTLTHSFTQRTMLYEISGSWLTGSGDPLRQWKPGYWDLVGLKDWVDVVNRLAGRTVIQMGYGEDAAAWFVRSGLH
jgi:hypothetical protein